MDGCREFRGAAPPGPLPQGPLLPSSRRQRGRLRNGSSHNNGPWWKAWMRKYVVACLVCGGLSVCHGIIFIVIYLLLRSYTSSLQFFETIPTYVPGVVFIITGLILMCFAKRRNRYAFLLKMAGGCCLVCALLCVVITVTTTVVHMNRLQTLHECVYTPQAKTCMCVSAIGDHNVQEAHRFVFNNTPNCEVVHGSLYSCLRALFSFSVLGILLCISCSMLVYQLLSHEKKRLYWEQLELRRRFLYQRHSHHNVCGCYDELYPWQLWEMLDYRFLAAHNAMLHPEEEPPAASTALEAPSGRRPWNWLPWPRHHRRQQQQDAPNLVSRLMSREQAEEPPPESGGPWRSECIHIFRPRLPPVRFGPRPHGGHRRTRSNDAVFHHLHMNPRYAQPYSLVEPHFAEIPRYLWGPPPPYSQPHSAEGAAGLEPLDRRELEQGGSSKMSTPLSERRFVCHNFSSDGITLTIGPNYGDPPDHKKEETCIVEVHVPYILNHKKDVVFHTLPTRNHRRSHLFKSLSNIPLGRTDGQPLSVIKACCDLREGPSEAPPSSLSYPPTLVEAPSEFKSSLVIATSPSTPENAATPLARRAYAQSMPNLTLSRSSASPRHLRRAPSSGDTSTSQDMADFDLEEDAPALCSPASSLPHDCDPFSNDSSDPDSSSCGAPPFAPSIIISRRPPTDCPIDCGIRHLHRYHPDKMAVRDSSFVVTIKSLNV